MGNVDWQALAYFLPRRDAFSPASALYPVFDRFARFLTQFFVHNCPGGYSHVRYLHTHQFAVNQLSFVACS
jgi:hypothetical protein